MVAKLVDVPAGSTLGYPVNFGSRPGFGISQFSGPALLNAFGGFVAANRRWASYSAGIGDFFNQAVSGSNWADTGITTHTAFDGGNRDTKIGIRQPPPPVPRFIGEIQGSPSPLGGFGDDGIECFDAFPTSGVGYSAMYFGNRCQTFVGSFRLGELPPVPTRRAAVAGGTHSFNDAPAGTTGTVNITTIPGVLNLVAVFRARSGLDDLPSVPGWESFTAPSDGAGDHAAGMSFYWRSFRTGDASTFSLTVQSTFRGQMVTFAYDGVDPLTPVETYATGVNDGTDADIVAATSVGANSLAAAFVLKEFPFAGPTGFTGAGWTGIGNFIIDDFFPDDRATWVIDAVKPVVTPGSSSGAGSFTGALSSAGTKATLMLHAGPGLDSTATSGDVSYVGLGFKPDLLMFIQCEPSAANQRDGTSWTYGAADRAGNQWCSLARSRFLSGDAGSGGLTGIAVRDRLFYDDACLGHIGEQQYAEPTTHDIKASLVSMDANGFTLNIATMTDPKAYVVFLAVKVNSGAGAISVGNSVSSGGVGTQAITGAGFQPEAVVVASSQTEDTTKQTDFGAVAFGMSDGLTRRSFWARADSGLSGGSPICCPTDWKGDALLTFADSAGPTMLAQADLASLDADGFTLDWTTNDGVARLFGWIALAVETHAGVIATTGTVDQTTTTVTLHATVTPNTDPLEFVEVFFDYGLTPAYGTTIDAGSYSGYSPIEISVTITGLIVGQTYHYQVRVVDAFGCVTLGLDEFFTREIPAKAVGIYLHPRTVGNQA